MENMNEIVSLEMLFDSGEAIIADIMTNGVSLSNHRQLIQTKTKFLQAILIAQKAIKDKRLSLKANMARDIKLTMDEKKMAKTPAKDEVEELSRPDRYELEKVDLSIETMLEIAKNRTYHLRINEIDINKVGIGADAPL